MEEQYYTPDITEFHVGFRFELYDDCSDGIFDWHEQTFCQTILPNDTSYIKGSVLWDFMALNNAIKEERVRVKKLCDEDWIELGFTKIDAWDWQKGTWNTWQLKKNSGHERMGHTDIITAKNKYNNWDIEWHRAGHESGVEGFITKIHNGYSGNIKNISELKRTLESTKILQGV